MASVDALKQQEPLPIPHLAFGHATHMGLVRRSNYDAYSCFVGAVDSQQGHVEFGLFAVASGGGWGGEGDKAAAIAVRVVTREIVGNAHSLFFAADGSPLNAHDALVPALEKANIEVRQGLTFDDLSQDTLDGAVLTAAAVIGNTVSLVHIGDNRAYVVSDAGIEQITRDHTLGQRLVELGHITRQEARSHPHKHIWYRFLGGEHEFESDTYSRALTPRSKILLCTDGLWQQVEEAEIFGAITGHSRPQDACDTLVSLANAHGGEDNVTVIVVNMPGSNRPTANGQ